MLTPNTPPFNQNSPLSHQRWIYTLSTLLSVCAFGLLLHISQQWIYRVDLTSDDRYTLSTEVYKLLDQLEEPLKIEALLPLSAPPPYQEVVAHMADLLKELKSVAKRPLHLTLIDTATERTQMERAELIQRAKDAQLPLTKLSAQRGGKRITMEVPFGVALSYLNQRAFIPALESLDEVEYELARALKQLTSRRAPLRLGIAQGFGEPQIIQSPLATQLASGGELIPVRLDGPSLIHKIDALLILGPTRPYGERARWLIDQLLCHGKGVVMAIDYRTQSEVIPSIWVPRGSGLESLFRAYGVSVDWRWVVADEENPSPASLSRDAQGRVISVDHPLYPRMRGVSHPITTSLKSLPVPMAPPITLPKKASVLLRSHPSAVALRDLQSLQIQDAKERKELESGASFSLAFALEQTFETTFTTPPVPLEGVIDPPHLLKGRGVARWVFIGSGRRLLSADSDALTFLKSSLDWVLGEEDLLKLRQRQAPPPRINVTSDQRHLIQWISIFTPFFILGVLSLWSRRWII